MSKFISCVLFGLSLYAIGCGGAAVPVDNPKDKEGRPNEEQLKKMHDEVQKGGAQPAQPGQ